MCEGGHIKAFKRAGGNTEDGKRRKWTQTQWEGSGLTGTSLGRMLSFARRPMKFQIILSKIMSTRKIAELAEHSVSRVSRRGFRLTEKLPQEK